MLENGDLVPRVLVEREVALELAAVTAQGDCLLDDRRADERRRRHRTDGRCGIAAGPKTPKPPNIDVVNFKVNLLRLIKID